jgi:hypothetical protein
MNSKYNYKNIILLIIIVIGIIIFNLYTRPVKESFVWSRDLIDRFLTYQKTINQNRNQYDMQILQQQASPLEAEQFLSTGYWPWTQETKQIYSDTTWHNPIIKIDPGYALDYAMKLYNENIAKTLLAWNTKEGTFLIYGGDLGASENMHISNTIKCADDENKGMEKTTYTGYNLWNGYRNSNTTSVPNEEIPNEMPGFAFVNGPCNPCAAFKSPSDYSCPFTLNVKGDNKISPIWANLWNIN